VSCDFGLRNGAFGLLEPVLRGTNGVQRESSNRRVRGIGFFGGGWFDSMFAFVHGVPSFKNIRLERF